MKPNLEELVKHTRKVYNFYQHEINNSPEVFWIINPRDYHFLKNEFKEKPDNSTTMPMLLEIPAVVAYVWRKLPIIAMNVQLIQDDIEINNDP